MITTSKTFAREGSRGRFRPYWGANIGELSATGKTPAEAKANLMQEVEDAFNGLDYDPILLPIPGGHIVVSRSAFAGWSYHFDRDGRKSGWTVFPKEKGEATKEVVLAAARRHAETINEDAKTEVTP